MSVTGIPRDCSRGRARAPDSIAPSRPAGGLSGRAEAGAEAGAGRVAAVGAGGCRESGGGVRGPKSPDTQVPMVPVSGLPVAGTAPDANAFEVSGATLFGAAK